MKRFIAAVGGALFASTSYGMVFGGSNLGIFGYPSHTCSKPYKPYRFNTQYELESFKAEYSTYIECIKTYVDNANNDIKRIRESANAAIDEANAPL